MNWYMVAFISHDGTITSVDGEGMTWVTGTPYSPKTQAEKNQQSDRDYRHLDPSHRRRQAGGALGERRPPELLAADGGNPDVGAGHIGDPLRAVHAGVLHA